MDIPDVLGLLEAVDRLDDPRRVAAYVVDHVRESTGARYAEVVAGHGPDLTVLATSDRDLTRELMQVRAQADAPPAPDTQPSGSVIVVDDLAEASPWDAFAELAVRRTPVRSAVLSYRSAGSGPPIVLPVSDDRPGHFTAERQAYVRLVSGLTAGALRGLADATSMADLREGLTARARVGTAVGVLVVRRDLTPDAAFDLLRRHSQQHGVKVRDLAERVLVDGDLRTDDQPA